MMARPIHLFISSSPDLALEREVLGQAVAELPISVGWEIKHTPRPGEDAAEPLAFLERCDLYLVVLGADFAAPMGLEWRQALRLGKPLLAYRKRTLHSPSAQTLLRESSVTGNVTWTAFDLPQELKTHITQALARTVLDRGEQFGLSLDDVQALLTLAGAKEEGGESSETERRRGAGRGGVILGRET
jgi:hypothetical protein